MPLGLLVSIPVTRGDLKSPINLMWMFLDCEGNPSWDGPHNLHITHQSKQNLNTRPELLLQVCWHNTILRQTSAGLWTPFDVQMSEMSTSTAIRQIILFFIPNHSFIKRKGQALRHHPFSGWGGQREAGHPSANTSLSNFKELICSLITLSPPPLHLLHPLFTSSRFAAVASN